MCIGRNTFLSPYQSGRCFSMSSAKAVAKAKINSVSVPLPVSGGGGGSHFGGPTGTTPPILRSGDWTPAD